MVCGGKSNLNGKKTKIISKNNIHLQNVYVMEKKEKTIIRTIRKRIWSDYSVKTNSVTPKTLPPPPIFNWSRP